MPSGNSEERRGGDTAPYLDRWKLFLAIGITSPLSKNLQRQALERAESENPTAEEFCLTLNPLFFSIFLSPSLLPRRSLRRRWVPKYFRLGDLRVLCR